MRSSILHYSLFIILALLIFRPILGPSWYPMHDSTHLTRLSLLTDTINSGQFPPIWAEGINNGYGYPLFHFYAPLFHLSSYVIHMLGFSLVTSLKLMLFFTSIIGALGMLKWVGRWGRLSGVVASIAFILSPYAGLNLYVRGAYSEYLALALMPWVFLALERLITRKQVILATCALSLFFLSHNLVPILATPFILVWAMFNNKSQLKNLLITAMFAFGLTAWFLLPVLFERGFTQTDVVAKTTDYALHFVSPAQIWNSTWGFGGSSPGVEDGMSFKLGKIQILLAAVGVIIALVERSSPAILITCATIFFVFLATPLSRFLWDGLSVLQMVQFPWRSLGLVSVLMSWLAGYTVGNIRSRPLRIGFVILMITSLFALNLKYFTPQTLIAPPSPQRDIASVVPEYMPRWMPTPPLSPAGPHERAYYPTWKVLVDGRSVPTSANESGILTYENPTNSQNVQLIQSHTNLEKISYLLSLLTFLTLLLYYFFPKIYAKL